MESFERLRNEVESDLKNILVKCASCDQLAEWEEGPWSKKEVLCKDCHSVMVEIMEECGL